MLGTATMYHILQESEEAKFNSGNNPIRCLDLPSKTVQTAMPCLAYRNTLFSSPILSDFDDGLMRKTIDPLPSSFSQEMH